jgi:hypothetical protein
MSTPNAGSPNAEQDASQSADKGTEPTVSAGSAINDTTAAQAQVVPAPQQPEGGPSIAVNTILRSLAGALAIVLVLLALLWAVQQIARHEASLVVKSRVGVVDIDQALSTYRTAYLELLAKDTASQDQREKAAAFIKTSTDYIDQAVAQIARECECVLLIRPAVLQSQQAGLIDYTDRLLELTSAKRP